jgi:hypothetical protein
MIAKNINQTTPNKALLQVLLPRLICVAPLYIVLIVGCKKTEPVAPAAVPTAAVPAPTAPAVPVPAFSAAQKIGMFVYPKNNQNHDQQLIDESGCYDAVEQQTGINPEAGGRRPRRLLMWPRQSSKVQPMPPNRAADVCEAQAEVRWAERRSARFPETRAGVPRSVQRSVRSEGVESNDNLMKPPKSREHKRPPHNNTRPMLKTRRHTTRRSILSSEVFQRVWTLVVTPCSKLRGRVELIGATPLEVIRL